jgi:3'(2'), 5'-bisphosphate nucleotidase
VSRSHLDSATEAALSKLPDHTRRQLGSSLKFALIAAGEADLYVRLAPTMAWDTAAGQAIVEAAGGTVLAEDGSHLSYSWNSGLRNAGFVAASRSEYAWLVVPQRPGVAN